MTEYIRKEEALNVLLDLFINNSWDGGIKYSEAKKAVANIQPSSVAPVKASRWIKRWCDNNMLGHEYEECESCGCIIVDDEKFWDAKFCPNCGSKMI